MGRLILIIDIETTNLKPGTGIICEVGIVELNLDTGERKIIFDSLCHQKPVTLEHVEKSWVVSNGWITIEEIRNSPDFVKILPKIQKIIDAYPNGVTAYNKQFDIGWLKWAGVKFGKVLPCPMILSTDICKIPSPYRSGTYKWPKVEEAYDHFFPDNDYTEIHRGGDDAFHEAQIVHELFKRGIFKL